MTGAPTGLGREARRHRTLDDMEHHHCGRESIAHAYLYCLTQPFATGSILTVDGGTALA